MFVFAYSSYLAFSKMDHFKPRLLVEHRNLLRLRISRFWGCAVLEFIGTFLTSSMIYGIRMILSA